MSKFKILWVDDQTKKCKRDSCLVENEITKLSFEPDIKFESDISKNSLDKEDGRLYKAITARDIDLFIIDYNLKDNVFGTDIIRKIRSDNNIYTDIIFYSSNAKQLIEAVKSSYDQLNPLDYFDGVYVVPLGNDFVEKVTTVIKKIIRSWYNVHSIRGIILSKSSKLEQLATSIISSNYMEHLESIKKVLLEKGNNITQNTNSKWEKVHKQDDPIPDILKNPIDFNWSVRRCILDVLRSNNAISISTWENLLEIFKFRNEFAHNPVHIVNGILEMDTSKGKVTYEEEKIDEIVKKIASVEDELLNLINGKTNEIILPNTLSEEY